MKLEFLKEPMEYLRPVLREVRQVEETAEAIIPDSCPDVQEVLASWGLAFLRGKELGEGVMNISAGVSASALTQPEGRDMPEVVEVYIPMTVRLESGVLHSGQVSRVDVSLKRLDGHLVNPRKVMVRATVSVSVWGYEPEREEHLTDPATGGIQVLKKTAPVKCLRHLGEKNYTVEDLVGISPEGMGQTVCGCQIRLHHTDQRLTGTRAVLKGEAEVEVLYLDESGHLKTGSGQLPFSQYIDLGDSTEQDELFLRSILTGAEVSFGSDGGSLNVILQLNTTAEVWGKQEIGYIGDMYSLQGQVKPEMISRCYDSMIDRQVFAPVGHGVLDGIMGRAVFVSCIPGDVSFQRSGEQVTFTMPVSAQVLYENEEGKLLGAVTRVELKAATMAAADCRFEAAGEDLTATGSLGGGLDVKISGNLTVNTFCALSFQEIAGGELEEREEKRNGPGIIIRRPKKGEGLWDIAKTYRTTTSAIAAANGMEDEHVPEKMLLIPGGR